MATELIENLVTQWLIEAEAAFLTEKCTEFNVNIPEAKVGNKQYLIRLITRYIHSEELEMQMMVAKLYGLSYLVIWVIW